MAPLTKQDLDEIDKRMDESISSQKLLAVHRDLALIHILRYFEAFVMLHPSFDEARFRRGQDGLHFAVQWILRHCLGESQILQLDTEESLYIQAGELHEAAMDYSEIYDTMAMLYRERAVGELDLDGVVRFCHANQLVADVEMADRFIGSVADAEAINISSLDPDGILNDVQPRPSGRARVKYEIPDLTFERITKYWSLLLSPLWELDESWDLGGYTVYQFRQFWIALATLCTIHHLVCFRDGIEDIALNSVVRIHERGRWENEMVRWSGLNRRVISTVLDDLIYDPDLYSSGRKQPYVNYQPFFPLGIDRLALSGQLVIGSNPERNMWDLVSIRREKLHAELRNQKESLWRQELFPRLTSYGLKVYGPIGFTYKGDKTDLDILAMDSRDYFAVGCELKWLTQPDSIKSVNYTDAELSKGLDQAELTLGWLKSKSTKLRQVTGLASNELEKYEFKTMVLSKNTIGSGWVHKRHLPIVNERLVDWILGDPHRRNLRTLWQVGEELRYLPKRGKHFKDVNEDIEFGGIRFHGEKTGARLLDCWDPSRDIDLTGIT